MITQVRFSIIVFFGSLSLSCSPEDDKGQPIPDVDLSAIAFRSDTHINTSKLPQRIFDYLITNYPGLTIKEAQQENNENIEVVLSDDVELIFDVSGNFLGKDDDSGDTFGDEKLQASALNPAIRSFLGTYFPTSAIKLAELENNGNYEITLSNGFQIIFSGTGEFLGLAQDRLGNSDSDDKDIKPSELPEIIRRYIEANYPEQVIMEAEEENNGTYAITLSNGVELKYDSNGKFLGAQDNNGNGED